MCTTRQLIQTKHVGGGVTIDRLLFALGFFWGGGGSHYIAKSYYITLSIVTNIVSL